MNELKEFRKEQKKSAREGPPESITVNDTLSVDGDEPVKKDKTKINAREEQDQSDLEVRVEELLMQSGSGGYVVSGDDDIDSEL